MENNDYDYSGFVRNVQAQSVLNNNNSGNSNTTTYSAPKEPVFVQPKEIEKPKKKNTSKRIIIVLLVIIYTAAVSAGSIFAYKEYIKHEIKTSIEEVWSDAFSGDYGIGDNTGDSTESKKEKKATSVSMNKKFKVGDIFEVTLTKSEWRKKVESSYEDSRRYYESKEGETYFVVQGKLKNISSKEINSDDLAKCELTVNDKYSTKGFVVAEIKEQGFELFYNVKPLEEVNVFFFVEVTDEMKQKCNKAELKASFPKDEDSVGSYDSKNYVDYVVSFIN